MIRNSFKSANDVLNSALWSQITESTPKKNSRIFMSTRLENMIYGELRKNANDGLNEIERQSMEKLNTFSSLIQDTFQAVYSIKPKRTDENTLTATARQFNKKIIERVLASEEYPAFKVICEGRELPEYEVVKEFSDQIFTKLDELLSTANRAKSQENKKFLDLLNKLEAQQEQLKEQISDMMKRHMAGSLSKDAENKLLRAANSANSKQLFMIF